MLCLGKYKSAGIYYRSIKVQPVNKEKGANAEAPEGAGKLEVWITSRSKSSGLHTFTNNLQKT